MAKPLMDLRPIRKLVKPLPRSLRAPVSGAAWVLFNFALGWFGTSTGHVSALMIVTGALDGTILSVIVVTRASGRFQAGITGLFGGLGLDNVANGGQTLITRAAQGIHGVVDSFMDAVGGFGNEAIHKAVEQAIVQGVWMAVIVILAALIAKWAQDSTAAARQTCTDEGFQESWPPAANREIRSRRHTAGSAVG